MGWFRVKWKGTRFELAGCRVGDYAFLFSDTGFVGAVKGCLAVESLGQALGRLLDGQLLHRGLEVEWVALGLARRMKAAEDAFGEMNRERPT